MLDLVAIFLAAAVVAVPLFRRLGLGTVLGYLAAGLLIGPSGLGWVGQVDQTLHFAEFGVVLLLFLIGLELEPARLWRMRTSVFVLGGLQMLATAAALFGLGLLFGLSWRAALLVGLALSMSSTAFATQILGERHELGTPGGRTAFGMLLFQDLAAIPVIAIVPLLGDAPAGTEGPGWLALFAVGGLVVAGRLLLRPAFRLVANVRSQELSTAAALLIVVGTALLMEQIGLSQELGAFIAGVLLADSEYRHDLEASIEPFKGLLLGLFFIAVGMSADLGLLVAEPLPLLAATVLLVGIKAAVLFAVARGDRLAPSDARRTAVVISQGGEFAFVLFAMAGGVGLLETAEVERLVMVVTLSMCTTPPLLLLDDRLRARAAKKAGEAREFDTIADDHSPVIIAGFGRFGQVVARLLRLSKLSFTALDASAQHVDFVRRFGNKIYYGDASRVDLLRAAGAERARVFVLAIDDFETSMRTLEVVQRAFPHLRIVARARNRQHAYALLGAGVEHVIRETFAASAEAGQIVLEQLGIPSSSARESVRRFMEYDEQAVRDSYHLRDDEAALIKTAREYAKQLEQIFEQDADAR
jgi:monovalent cation:proton antiporter-2 (CPA2) family protein